MFCLVVDLVFNNAFVLIKTNVANKDTDCC